MQATSDKSSSAVRTSKRRPKKPGQKPSEISLRVEAGSCDYGLFLRHLRAESNSPQMTPTLRELFDEWVDTGLHANGEEHPFERNPNQTPNAIWICDAFLKKNPSTTMLGSGAHRISFPTVSTDTMLSIVFSGESASPEKWKEYAVQTFIEFLGTPRCLHFAKCRGCSQYFDLKKKPKAVYSGGWHCAKCQKQIEANRSTLATHKARTLRKVECYVLAARAWAKWKEDSAEPESDWILSQALEDSPHKVARLKLKVNWITLHREEIRDMALGLRRRNSGGPVQDPGMKRVKKNNPSTAR
jgi:hypothetical protein